MNPLGIIYGIATFYGLKKLQKPLRKTAVVVTSELFNVLDHSKEMVYNLKESCEDIIAEAHYENLKKNQLSINLDNDKGGEE